MCFVANKYDNEDRARLVQVIANIVIIVGVLISAAQLYALRQSSEKVVVDFSVIPKDENDDKSEVTLSIKNKGNVDIKDVRVYLTVYWLKPEALDENNHLHLNINNIAYGSTKGTIPQQADPPNEVRSGESISIPLDKYLEFDQHVDNELIHKQIYATRIVFRNAFSGQKYTKYLILSPTEAMPLVLGNLEEVVDGGMATTLHFGSSTLIQLRNAIVENQAAYFGDDIKQLYEN